MIAIVSKGGIRLKGVGPFQSANPGTIEKFLDKVEAQKQPDGKRLCMESIDEAVVRYSVHMDEVVKTVQAFGIELQVSDAA